MKKLKRVLFLVLGCALLMLPLQASAAACPHTNATKTGAKATATVVSSSDHLIQYYIVYVCNNVNCREVLLVADTSKPTIHESHSFKTVDRGHILADKGQHLYESRCSVCNYLGSSSSKPCNCINIASLPYEQEDGSIIEPFMEFDNDSKYGSIILEFPDGTARVAEGYGVLFPKLADIAGDMIANPEAYAITDAPDVVEYGDSQSFFDSITSVVLTLPDGTEIMCENWDYMLAEVANVLRNEMP